jgi:hypothetical protein
VKNKIEILIFDEWQSLGLAFEFLRDAKQSLKKINQTFKGSETFRISKIGAGGRLALKKGLKNETIR